MHEVARRLLDLDGRQRHRVLAADVGEDRDVHAEQAAVAQRVVGVGMDHPLVGEHRAGVDVDADERRTDRGGDGQRRARVVLQHVDPEGRGRVGAPDLGGHDAHGGDGRRLDAAGGEGRVAEVLDEQRVDPALDQRAGVRERGGDHAGHRAVPAGAAGQGREVHHADQRARESHQR